jgi:hypothetical protein
MNFHERLTHLLEINSLKPRDLYLEARKSPATILNYTSGKTYPDGDFFLALKKIVPNLNANWLIFGEGGIYQKQEPSDLGGDQGSGSQETEHKGTPTAKRAEAVHVVKQEIEQLKEMFKSKVTELEQTLVAVSGKIRVAASATLSFCTQVVRNQDLQLCK